ncbi:MAG: sigma-70 family RNA polymerase sigma factor [Nitrospira sp. CG24C]|nr:MAG: sigma-70 family RNA polymerase sigma factor [Nitrospira sp. CG24C]
MVRRSNQSTNRRAQVHSGQDPIQQIQNARAAILSFLRKRVGDDGVVQDLFQQSVLRAIERQSSLRRREDAVAWFYSILRHALVDYLRKRAVEERGRKAYSQALIHSGHGKVPPFEEVASNLCCCAYAILPSLRPSHAELIRRIDLGGESSKTVAQDLGITRNNVRVQLHRARQVLRARLVRFCGRCCKRDCRDCTCDVSAFPTMKSRR